MKKYTKLFALFMVLCMLLTGCGGSAKSQAADSAGPADYMAPDLVGSSDRDTVGSIEKTEESISGAGNPGYISEDEGSSITSIDVTAINKADVKLIYRANLTVQTTEFDKSTEDLKALAEKFGGYFESIRMYNGSYYYGNSNRSGDYTVRIPSEKYSEFISAMGSSFHVTNVSQQVEDIGTQYFEVESRLNTLRNKEARLQELLKEAENLEDIITLESALSDVQYELDMYGTTLNRYDSLINYSTVTVSLEEVTIYEPTVAEELTFWQKLAREFKWGASNFADAAESFAYWISYNIFGIIIFVIIVFAVIRFILPLRRKRKNRRAAKTTFTEENGTPAEMTGGTEEKKE